ncbi:unnamed protein product [Urochloa humidicola]
MATPSVRRTLSRPRLQSGSVKRGWRLLMATQPRASARTGGGGGGAASGKENAPCNVGHDAQMLGGAHDKNSTQGPTVDDLFSSPAPAALLQLPVRRPRQRRVFDMSAVRRSARLAKKPAMPAIERAQRNLWRKLGVGDDEFAPIEQVLQEFISMFQGALPAPIIAALTALFELEDDDAEHMNEALLQMVGEAVDDLQNELDAEADP